MNLLYTSLVVIALLSVGSCTYQNNAVAMDAGMGGIGGAAVGGMDAMGGAAFGGMGGMGGAGFGAMGGAGIGGGVAVAGRNGAIANGRRGRYISPDAQLVRNERMGQWFPSRITGVFNEDAADLSIGGAGLDLPPIGYPLLRIPFGFKGRFLPNYFRGTRVGRRLIESEDAGIYGSLGFGGFEGGVNIRDREKGMFWGGNGLKEGGYGYGGSSRSGSNRKRSQRGQKSKQGGQQMSQSGQQSKQSGQQMSQSGQQSKQSGQQMSQSGQKSKQGGQQQQKNQGQQNNSGKQTQKNSGNSKNQQGGGSKGSKNLKAF